MTPPYPLASAPGVHVFLVYDSEADHTTCRFATASQHKAAEKWAALFEAGADFQAQAWHGDTYRIAYAGWGLGHRTWSVTP